MSMELRGETLSLVLSHLTEAYDLVRCTAVNKAWAAACTYAQPRSVHLEQRESLSPVVHMQEAVQQLRWLQSLQRMGRLQNLQEAYFMVTNCFEDINPTPLAHGFGVIAGLHHLHRCKIEGTYCLSTILSLLPTSLVTLDLWPETGPDVICLSSFQQFTHLECLRLGVGVGYGFAGYAPDQMVHTLAIDTVLVCLKTMVIHDELQCSMQPGYNILHCLPNVCRVKVTIRGDTQGVELAEKLLLLPSVAKLQLTLLKSENAYGCNLVVPEQSMIAELAVTSPEKPFVCLSLGKRDILLCCQGTIVYTKERPEDLCDLFEM